MTSFEGMPIPLVCSPSAIPPGERARHFARGRELLEVQATERADITGGYAFRFAPTLLLEVVRFVDNERQCCPFITFVLQMDPDNGPLWLRMTGPAGTREVLQAELSLESSCKCRS